MDPVSAALTNAMLQAVVRLDAPASQAPLRTGPAHSLTDFIETALRRDGARNPGQKVDQYA
jgi:hypothetical protein